MSLIFRGGGFKEKMFVAMLSGAWGGGLGGEAQAGKYHLCVWFMSRVFHFYFVDS